MEKNISFFAPEIDAVVKDLNSNSDLINQNIFEILAGIYNTFSCVKPIGDDDIRQIWIEVERGSIENFGDFEEYVESGEVNSLDEFLELWKAYYPEKTKWYKFQTAKFRDDLYFYFGDKQIFTINNQLQTVSRSKYCQNLASFELFVQWLSERIIEEISKLKIDPTAYNQYIQKNLPWTKRVGRIKRIDFWNILGTETLRPDIGLGEKLISELKDAISVMKEKEIQLVQEMTANKFFRICEICFDSNDYFKKRKETLTPREKYISMADGRDAGLRNINGDSPQAFSEWYTGNSFGAHPWEICRGGNSTHISLFVSIYNGRWAIRLAGSSIMRVEETARMAVALYQNNIPFELSDAEQIANMVTGTDFIGIVPDNVTPRYCHSLFPPEDQIIDFMNFGFDMDIRSKIIEKTYFYPLKKIEIVK
jgi:hypothetical protein